MSADLLTLKRADEDKLRKVRTHAGLLPAAEAKRLNAVVIDHNNTDHRRRYTVMLLEDKQSIKQTVSNVLKTNSFLIHFEIEEPMLFDIYFREAYPEFNIAEPDESIEKRSKILQENDKNSFFDLEGDGRSFLPEEYIEDDADSLGRINLTDLSEFEKNSKRPYTELASVSWGRLIMNYFIQSRGSDLYIECNGKYGRIRVMIDDRLQLLRPEYAKISRERLEDLIRTFIGMTNRSSSGMKLENIDSAIKVAAMVNRNYREFEFRFHSHPTAGGTSVVIRSQAELITDFSKSGIEDFQIEMLRDASQQRQGMVLITGATGSGKSGTLECVYDDLQTEGTKKIIEIVDTVEMVSTLRDQIEVNDSYTWDDAIKACLRSKPHVIGIGEIRDAKVTRKGVESAQTGHLVLATYHAGNILKTLARLRQMDVDILQLAPALTLIHSQILVNKLCDECAARDMVATKEFGTLIYMEGRGCEHCDGKKYKGKTALAETLKITEEVEDMLIEGVPTKNILTAMREQGLFQPFAVTARLKVFNGITSVKEAKRMLGDIYDQFYGEAKWQDLKMFDPKYKMIHPKRNGLSNIGQAVIERIQKLHNMKEMGEHGEKDNAGIALAKIMEEECLTEAEIEALVQTAPDKKGVAVRL